MLIKNDIETRLTEKMQSEFRNYQQTCLNPASLLERTNSKSQICDGV